MRRGFSLCVVLLLAPLGVSAQGRAPDAGLYEVVTETSMPNLDDNLRYATTRERRCLDKRDLARAFPVLNHVALRDCELVLASQEPDGASYTLSCTGGHGTSGGASWVFDPSQLFGTLTVKLGGKNMTFHQRITARALGACPSNMAAPGSSSTDPSQPTEPHG